MTSASPAAGGVTPAHLGFLAIFNPSLGNTDDTIDDQIVYYASVTTQTEQRKRRRRAKSGRPTEGLSQEERHERLRQIGLAQGMASFSRGFADGAAVDSVDTDKTRVVLHELEPGWWILASIDLTKIPLPPRLPTKSGEGQEDRFEYSTREMKPPGLLLNDLLRAHNIFLMHHDTSLSALFVRSRRSKFVAVLSRYWDLFLSTWNVLLHGNPVRDCYGGINIAASGELGVGVGEEERGSSEREVLEGLVGRIEGLVDLAVSRFGEYDTTVEDDGGDPSQWLGTGQEPGPEDGAIFLGTGALSRKSLRDITHWMEDLYTWGDHAYGLIESPTSVRRKRQKSKTTDQAHAHDESQVASTATAQEQPAEQSTTEPLSEGASNVAGEEESKMDKMMSYVKLGYGTYWSLPGQGGSSEAANSETPTPKLANKTVSPERPKMTTRESSFDEAGHYLIGLKGDIEDAGSDREEHAASDDEDANNARTVLRTVNVEIETNTGEQPEATIIKDFQHPASILTQSQVMGNMVPGYNSHDLNKANKLRVVVYVNRPFIFAFLFKLRTDSLAWETLYKSLHYQLAPLKKQLLASTTYRPERPSAGISGSSIYDLVWDSKLLTVHSTIPNIPETYEPQDSWSRADALSTHLHLLNIHSATRAKVGHFERTQKTSRGWWIVWTRLLDDSNSDDLSGSQSTLRGRTDTAHSDDEEEDTRKVGKEIFLIRRASDHIGFRGEGGGGSDGAGRLAQGIGVDTRRYVEELLSLL